jgi:hypothetical protein
VRKGEKTGEKKDVSMVERMVARKGCHSVERKGVLKVGLLGGSKVEKREKRMVDVRVGSMVERTGEREAGWMVGCWVARKDGRKAGERVELKAERRAVSMVERMAEWMDVDSVD